MNKNEQGTFLILIAMVVCLSPYQSVLADNLSDAHRLLRITDMGEKFKHTTQSQTADIVRTYSSIVVMTTDVTLPESIKRQIANCYYQTYTWEKFEPGIARIFADTLSQTELRILIDFFSDRSIPPAYIELFKNLRDKSGTIERLSIDYIVDHSEGCDKQNVSLILAFLATTNFETVDYYYGR